MKVGGFVSENRTRVNITVNNELLEFFQDYADRLGVPRSTAMVIALNSFKDQQDMLKVSRYLNNNGSVIDER